MRLWRRCARPFLVGRIYDRDDKPGPYLNGDCDASQIAALGASLSAARRTRTTAQEGQR